MHLNSWHMLVIAMAGWMNREQSAVIEYLKEENRVLRELLGDKRPRLNDDQRRLLAAKGGNADSTSLIQVSPAKPSGRDAIPTPSLAS